MIVTLRNIALRIALLLLFLYVLDRASGHFIPGTYSEVMEHFGPPGPVAYSDYLPYTTPANVSLTGDLFGTMTFNALGYRGDAPRTVEKPNGVFRVLFVGDSFTLGWGVSEEESTIGRIRSALRSRYPSVEVINAGYHDGYSPDAYYAYLRKEGIALKPDLIVIDLYTGNDITDLQDNIWVTTDDSGAPTSLYSNRTITDYRGQFLNPTILSWNYRVPILRESHLFIAATNIINHFFFPQVGIQQGRFGQSLSMDEAWRRFDIVTKATVQYCASQHIPLLYVAIPFPGTSLDQDIYNPGIQKLIEDQLHLPYLTTHNLFTVADQIPNDGHLNSQGSQVLADAMLKFITPYLAASSF